MDKSRRELLLQQFEKVTELPLMVLAVAIVPLLVIPLAVKLSQTLETAFVAVDWTIWAVFAVELSVRTYLVERRLQYLLRHWYDVLIVVLPFLRPLRVLRSTRALRLARVAPFALRATTNARDLIQARGLHYVLMLGLLAVFASASAMYLVERNNGGNIDDYGTALWWAISTMTTVGYGDVYPVSAEGRGIAVFLMLVGITFFSWITANIAAFLVEFGGDAKSRVTMTDLMLKLEAVEAELRALREAREAF